MSSKLFIYILFFNANNTKYMYDPATDKLYTKNTETGEWNIEASRKIKKLTKGAIFKKAIEKALRYLGEIE